MTVVPDEASQLVEKCSCLSRGAGKVTPGQRVQIKFSSYPYQEFGMVRGLLKTSRWKAADTYYVVEVGFPDGLISNYGRTLPFSQEMQGTAEIITEKRRLLTRLLQPLHALMSRD